MRSLHIAAVVFVAACGSNAPTSPLSTSWIAAQTPYCAAATTDQTQFYASCDSTLVWARGAVGCFYVYACPEPELCGASFLTIACVNDADCPNGTQCADIPGGGACLKTCHAFGNADCGRCDLWCNSDGACGAGGPGYPTNLPCDATHPGIDATLHGVGLGTEYYNNWSFTLPGASLRTTIQYEQIVDGDVHVVFPWPAGTTAGPATSLYSGEGPGVLNYTCAGTFTADPTACVAVDLACTDGRADAGGP